MSALRPVICLVRHDPAPGRNRRRIWDNNNAARSARIDHLHNWHDEIIELVNFVRPARVVQHVFYIFARDKCVHKLQSFIRINSVERAATHHESRIAQALRRLVRRNMAAAQIISGHLGIHYAVGGAGTWMQSGIVPLEHMIENIKQVNDID